MVNQYNMIAADQGIYLLSAKFLSLIVQLYHGNSSPLDNLYNIMISTRAAMKHIVLLLNEDYTYYSILNTPNILNEVVCESYAAYSGPNVVVQDIHAIPPLHRAQFENLVLYLLSSLIHTAVAINNMNNNNIIVN